MTENSKKMKNGQLSVIMSGICWGMISPFVRTLSSEAFDTYDIAALRTWGAAFLLFIYLFISDREKLRIRIRDLWLFIGSGILSLSFFSICYFETILSSGSSVAVALLYTAPAFVMLESFVFFREKISFPKTVSVFMTILGAILVSGILNENLSFMGFLTGIGAGFGYSLYSVFAGLAVKKYSSLTVSFYTFLCCSVSFLFLRFPGKYQGLISAASLMLILLMSLICSVIPYILYSYGLKNIEKSRAAVLVTVEPLVGTVIGVIFYREDLGILKILGIILIFTAVVILNLPDKNE